jgi:uncharacterized protein YozE (UPF0346 family)
MKNGTLHPKTNSANALFIFASSSFPKESRKFFKLPDLLHFESRCDAVISAVALQSIPFMYAV